MRWRRRRVAREGLLDLTGDSAFLLSLLDHTWRWRQRHVETLEFGAGEHVHAESRYQVEFPAELLEPFLGRQRPRAVRTLVPLTTRDKRPLFRLDVRGPGGRPAPLLLRSSIAALQAEYLARLVATSVASPTLTARLPRRLLEAVCVFTPAVARELGADEPDGLASYLSDGTGLSVSRHDVDRWRRWQEPAVEALRAALDESPDTMSSAENVLLAVPYLDPPPASIGDIARIVGDYVAAVGAAEAAGDTMLLGVLAEYGRRWEVIVETDVPVGRPCTIGVSEDRPLRLDQRGRCGQWVAAGDARAFHLEARIADHTVAIADYGVRDRHGMAYGIPLMEGARYTDEALVLYSAVPERPFHAYVELHLRPVSDVRLVGRLVTGIAGLSAAGVVLVPTDHRTVAVMGVLTFPTTFAVALALVREASPLARLLQRRARRLLASVTAALWLVAVWRVATGLWWW